MKKIILLFTIILLAAFLRFYNVSSNPPSLDWDEAANAWNAYSIVETGSDEYGIVHPITLRSFNDYKPALYAYAMMPAIKLFGLNEFAVRFPSALAGSLLPLAVYLIFVGVRHGEPLSRLSFLAAFLTAINPWMIQFSRGGFEANLALSILIWGIVVFMYFYKHVWGLVYGATMILSSVYTYHSNKFVAPVILFVFTMFLLIKKKISWKNILILLIISVIVLVPFIRSIIRGYGLVRLNETSGNFSLPNLLRGFLSHFNFDFLFLNADGNTRHHVTGFGLFYLFESILMFFGVLNFLKNGRHKLIFFMLFFISLIPSSLAESAPHAIRSILSFPFFLIFVALGFKEILSRKMFKIAVLALYVYFLFFYANSLYKHYPTETSQNWQYGYQPVTDYLFKENNYNKYTKIIMTNAYDQPYIYMLLGGRDKFLSHKNNGAFQNGFGKFEFKKINFDEEKNQRDVLLIGTEEELREATNVLDTIYFLDGKVAFKIIKI
jgi:4-amino-4-deoxy-L-arabinose transferase-like glycosyltransferase